MDKLLFQTKLPKDKVIKFRNFKKKYFPDYFTYGLVVMMIDFFIDNFKKK